MRLKNIDLPEVIKVKIKKLSKGKYFAELIDYGVFTEVDNEFELMPMINDLIYTLFDIPKELQKEFHYEPKKDDDFEKYKPFIMYSTKEFFEKHLQS